MESDSIEVGKILPHHSLVCYQVLVQKLSYFPVDRRILVQALPHFQVRQNLSSIPSFLPLEVFTS